jgi:thiamine biosynthesis lipoprotein
MIEAKAKALGVSRRRFIAITAAMGAASAVPRRAAARELETCTWKGVALGAQASLTLQHHDGSEARSAIEACLGEVARLEAIFSLFQPESALARLNATGRIDAAPADLRVLLAEALGLAARTDGAFDPTIQPLWALYARHFNAQPSASHGPSAVEIGDTHARVGWQKVAIDGSRIELLAPGMAVTLNGIAQGYITDKVGELLNARGFEHVLVNMGEQLALGPKWEGDAWRVGIADPNAPSRVLETVALGRGAVATTGGYGCSFDAAGRFPHLIDANTGGCARVWASVTVLADRATVADGLSTALSVMPAERAPAILSGRARAYVVSGDGGAGRWL